MLKLFLTVIGVLFFCDTTFAAIDKSAIVAWKFPVINGIVYENGKIVKWDVPSHPTLPTEGEIATWTQEYADTVIVQQQKDEELNKMGKILQALSPAAQKVLIKALKAKAQEEGLLQ